MSIGQVGVTKKVLGLIILLRYLKILTPLVWFLINIFLAVIHSHDFLKMCLVPLHLLWSSNLCSYLWFWFVIITFTRIPCMCAS